jgi:hypothetical protein
MQKMLSVVFLERLLLTRVFSLQSLCGPKTRPLLVTIDGPLVKAQEQVNRDTPLPDLVHRQVRLGMHNGRNTFMDYIRHSLDIQITLLFTFMLLKLTKFIMKNMSFLYKITLEELTLLFFAWP